MLLFNCLVGVLRGPHKKIEELILFNFNPSTPELNPSVQRCLMRFLLGILLI
jgi:hypothetical protein